MSARDSAGRRVVVIGGGIVGAAVAAHLSEHATVAVTLLERGPVDRLLGSTGHAPGFVGLLGEAPVATGLARASADAYSRLERGGQRGFDRVGGLEVAGTVAAMASLRRRAELAGVAGLTARVLDAAETAACAPELVDVGRCVGGVLHPEDGTARADVITAAYKERAVRNGAVLVHDAAVTAVDRVGDRVAAVRCGDVRHRADDVVVACGIWGPEVAALAGQGLPLVPVAHPYVHGPSRPAQPSVRTSPFVRWPEHHVYARSHGDRLGLGTYDHVPVPVDRPGPDAEESWDEAVFGPAVDRALDLLPAAHRFVPAQRLSGVFSMTPDNLPLLGPVTAVPGLWMAQALWVTHAGGAARSLVELMTGTTPGIAGLDALRPDRFAGRSAVELRAGALRLYRDIYAVA